MGAHTRQLINRTDILLTRTVLHSCAIALFVLFLSSCSNTRHLDKGETLFRGSKVKILDNETEKDERKVLKNDLEGLVRPRPNTKSLGFIRIKLTLYNLAGDTKKTKGIRQWLRNKAGEAPVTGSSVNLDANNTLMVNHLQNKGFFNASVTSHMDTVRRKKTTAAFEVVTGQQYTINEVHFRLDSSEIAADIDTDFVNTMLKTGNSYNLDVIKAERSRIDRMLKEKGYFYFRADYILVVADSSIGNHKVNMYVRLKHREIPEEAYRKYTINDIFIYANFRLQGSQKDTGKQNMVKRDSYYIVDRKNSFHPYVFADAMIFEKGDVYSLDDQNASLSRLVNMGTFKFVKNRFDPVGTNLMDVYYYLTPFPRKSLRFEIGALTQNDNRTGTRGNISWRNRNAFKGAEELMFKINAGAETQSTGVIKQPGIVSYGAEANLAFPRFVVPFIDIQTLSRYLPRSIIKLKYNYEAQIGRLSINSYIASYGYSWKEGPRKQHQLYPINFTYVRTDILGTIRGLDSLYQNLVFNGIIVGPTYEFTYNSQVNQTQSNSFYFDGLIDLSGNILGVAQKADFETNPQYLFGSTYAQYVKIQPDFRYYIHLSNSSIVATRAMFGIGIPYGNSRELPNIKRFWAGGNSDLRGFPSRLVGPGTYYEPAVHSTTQYIQTLGDLKLELNAELRQNIYRFLNLGLFVDAGNIWMYRDNPAFPGGQFTNNFYKQLAVDVGTGLRFDFKILILRLDLGIPVRKPWIAANNGWVFDAFDLKSSDWRKNNLVFNIAIGYPF